MTSLYFLKIAVAKVIYGVLNSGSVISASLQELHPWFHILGTLEFVVLVENHLTRIEGPSAP